ncbi:MAG TPA: hypothetical protein VMI06_14480 [Terriglobia bacterium]|nr:hypothetical protein [Terriglobia bacterium]
MMSQDAPQPATRPKRRYMMTEQVGARLATAIKSLRFPKKLATRRFPGLGI